MKQYRGLTTVYISRKIEKKGTHIQEHSISLQRRKNQNQNMIKTKMQMKEVLKSYLVEILGSMVSFAIK